MHKTEYGAEELHLKGKKLELPTVMGTEHEFYCNLEENMKIECNMEMVPVLVCRDPVYGITYYVNYGRDNFIYAYRDGEKELAVAISARDLYCRKGELYFIADSDGQYQFSGFAQGNILKYNPADGTVVVVEECNADGMVVYQDGICYRITGEIKHYEGLYTVKEERFFLSFATGESTAFPKNVDKLRRWNGYLLQMQMGVREISESDPLVQKMLAQGYTIAGVGGVDAINTVDMQGKDSRKYRYTGERIFCYAPAEDRLTELGIEEPMDICVAEEGKLCVYAHRGEEFCLLLYDTDRETMKVMAKTREYKMANVAFCKERQGVIYQASGGGLVLSVLPDLETESELYPGGLFWDNNLCYINGMVACTAMNGGILQFPLERVKCENKALRYITTGESVSKPFGCGYEIQRRVLEPDKFALKVMALDRDFDICFVDSGDSFGYQLKEKGLFYSLNEVAGIQEYLDACFPYVKEAATDEDGNVWMLPVAVNIRSLLVSREAADKVIIRENMTYEEYALAYDALSEKEKRVTEKPSSFAETFLVRYILSRGTVDTEEFRRILQGMAESESVQPEETKGVYCRIIEETDYRAYFVRQYGPEATIYAEPKLSATDKNTGSCLFLAVNPYSDNLDTALQYISAWIAYTMGREDAPLFFAEREVADTPYDRSLYQLYRNGAIAFSVEDDLYEGYSEVLNGTENLEEYVSRTEARVDMFLNE